MSKSVLITGAYGFLGRNIAKLFAEKNYDVFGLGHGSWKQNEWLEWGISEWNTCDVNLNNLSLYGKTPDVIVHCAGSGSVGYSIKNPLQDFERTVLTTSAILEYIRLFSPHTKLIVPSSAAVYGQVKSLPISENAPLNPISPYGVHKKICEELCHSYAKFFSVSVLIVRFFSIYGVPLRKQLMWDILKKIEANNYSFCGSGYEVRDFLNVSDAAKLLYFLTPFASPLVPVYNGGTGKGVMVKTIVESIFSRLNCDKSPIFTEIIRNGDPEGYVADVSKIRAMGWQNEISLESGINEYIYWYLEGAI